MEKLLWLFVQMFQVDKDRCFYFLLNAARNEATECVEYDLDNEDDDWLQQFNRERTILSHERYIAIFEQLDLLDQIALCLFCLHT